MVEQRKRRYGHDFLYRRMIMIPVAQHAPTMDMDEIVIVTCAC
jgi:hypothetical protein